MSFLLNLLEATSVSFRLSRRAFAIALIGCVLFGLIFALYQPDAQFVPESFRPIDGIKQPSLTVQYWFSAAAYTAIGLAVVTYFALGSAAMETLRGIRVSRTVTSAVDPADQPGVIEGPAIEPLSPSDAPLEELHDRLASELDRQVAIGVFNLGIGLSLFFIGAGLGLYLVFIRGDLNTQTMIGRLVISIGIQVASFFFLLNYRKTMNETRYLHNEMSNIQFRRVAVRVAYERNKSEYFNALLAAFLTAERNVVLKPGETLADIKLTEMDLGFADKMADRLFGLMGRQRR